MTTPTPDPATAPPRAVSGARVPRSGKTATPSQPPRGGVASPSPSPAESLPAGEAPSSSLTDVTVPSTIRRGAARTPTPVVAAQLQAAAEQSPARGVRGADDAPLAGPKPEGLSGKEWRSAVKAATSAQHAATRARGTTYVPKAARPAGGRYVPGGNRRTPGEKS